MKYQEIKEKIKKLNCILVGTVLKKFKKCGRKNCKCMKDQEYLHGPYFIWTRKEKGKTVTKTITQKQAKECHKAFKNMKILNSYVEGWKKESIEYIEQILEKK
jgi:hypothetical protein